MILLNPGPVTLTARVRAALTAAELCHREPEFADLQDAIRARLLAVYGLAERAWAAIVLSGSGTAAVEAMISSLPGENARLLIIENGVYGERMTQIAAVHGIDHERLEFGWGQPIDPTALAARLNGGAFTHVAVVHHETTTGRLNDLRAIGECCHGHGAALLVDAVSSFGAEAIDCQTWHVSAVAATANKCLHGAPGAAFVLVARDALASGRARCLYLDLAGHCAKQDARSTLFTPAIPAFYALAAALAEHAEAGGWAARRARYVALAGRLAEGLGRLGVQPLLSAADCSCVLRAYYLPAGLGYARLHDRLKNKGFVIYAGQGRLASLVFRLAVMGAITDADMDRLVAAIGTCTADMS